MLRRFVLAWAFLGGLSWTVSAMAQVAVGPCGTCGSVGCFGAKTGTCSSVSGGVAGFSGGAPWGASRFSTLYPPGPCDQPPTRTALARLGLERAWLEFIPLGATERLMTISLAENLILAQTSLANLTAIDAESGQLLWTANLGRPTGQARAAAVNSDSVFVSNANVLYQLDRATGREVRAFALEDFATSPPAANEEFVAVGTNGGRVVGFRVRDHSREVPPGPRAGFAFAWKSASTATSRPIVTDRILAFGSQDRRLFVATVHEPQEILYRFLTGGPIVAALGNYGNRTILVPSMDNNLYAVDVFNPEDPRAIHWEFATGAPIDQEPLVSGEDIYVINSRGVLFSVEPKTGVSEWVRPTGGGKLLALSPKRVYLLSPDGDLFLVDRATGDVLASPRATRERAGLCLRRYEMYLTNHLNDRVYLATKSGEVLALREVGALEPRHLREGQERFATIPTAAEAVPTPPGAEPPDAGAMPPGAGAP
jgi:outer membrane protein assembly factor BamB